MDRRGFLGVILAAAVAPAIVRADSLMRIVPRDLFVLEIGRYEGIKIIESGPVSTNPDDWVARVDISDADKSDPLAQTSTPYVMSLAEFERKYPGVQAYVYPKGALVDAMRPSNDIIELARLRRAIEYRRGLA